MNNKWYGNQECDKRKNCLHVNGNIQHVLNIWNIQMKFFESKVSMIIYVLFETQEYNWYYITNDFFYMFGDDTQN